MTYNRLKQVGGPANNEILPHSIYNDMQATGRAVEIIESPVTAGVLLTTVFNTL